MKMNNQLEKVLPQITLPPPLHFCILLPFRFQFQVLIAANADLCGDDLHPRVMILAPFTQVPNQTNFC